MRQYAAQLVQPGLGARVRKRLERGHPDAVDGPDVDHARRVHAPLVARLGGGLEQRRQQLREGEDAVQVQRQHTRPRAVRVLVVGRAPIAAAVVDQHVQLYRRRQPPSLVNTLLLTNPGAGKKRRTLLTLAELPRQRFDLVELVKVRRDGVRLAAPTRPSARLVELAAGGGAGGGVARRHIHLGAVGDVPLADHAADALGAAGDEDDLALRAGAGLAGVD
jgi:hypothetical protein